MADEIVKTAAEDGAGLIVPCRSNKDLIEQIVVGSATESVLARID